MSQRAHHVRRFVTNPVTHLAAVAMTLAVATVVLASLNHDPRPTGPVVTPDSYTANAQTAATETSLLVHRAAPTPTPLAGKSWCSGHVISVTGDVPGLTGTITELQALGFTLLHITHGPADITVSTKLLDSTNVGLTTMSFTGDTFTHVTIEVDPGSGSMTLRHEFGHALGLAHASANQYSVMHAWLNDPRSTTDYSPADRLSLQGLAHRQC